MRVALVHNVLAGGALRRMREQVQRLDSEILEFHPEGAADVTDAPVVIRCPQLSPSLPRPIRPPFRYADLHRLRAGWRRLAAAVDAAECDVVFANPCHWLQAPLALQWVASPSVYFCDEPRRVDYEDAARESRNRETRWLYGPLYAREKHLDRRATLSADVLLSNGEYSSRRIQEAYGRGSTVVPMGVSPFFTPGRGGKRHCLSVGTLIPGKGHDLALEAVGLAAVGLPLIVVAPRPNREEEARLRSLARRLDVRLDVRVGVTDAELRDLYRAAFVTLYLARAEPFGLVSLEAQACGSPVIVSDEGGLPETVADGEGGWIVSRAPQAAAGRLTTLRSEAVWSRMSLAAKAVGHERTWQRSAAALEMVFESVVSARRGGGSRGG